METGLLWFDDEKLALKAKIERAAQRYYQKFGVRPNACLVNPAALEGKETKVNGIRIIAARDILPHHFLLGVMRSHPSKSRDNS